MPSTPVITVNVAGNFDAFMQQFNRYQTMITRTNNTWTQINTTINNTTTNINRVNRAATGFSNTMKSILRTVESITGSFIKWGSLIGGSTALIGFGGGLLGIDRLANMIMTERRRAAGLGLSYSQLKAYQTVGPMFLGSPEMALSNLATARTDITSTQRRAFSTLFGMGAQQELAGNPATVMMDFMDRAAAKLQGYRPEVQGTMANTLGLTSVVSMEDLRVWMSMTDDERKARRKDIEEIEKAAQLSKQQQRDWSELSLQIRKAGVTIETALIKKLSTLVVPLTKLSQGFTDIVLALLDMPIIKIGIESLAKAVSEFAKYLASPEGKKAIDSFISSLNLLGAQIWQNLPKWSDLENYLIEAGKALKVFLDALITVAGWISWALKSPQMDPEPKPGEKPKKGGGSWWDWLFKNWSYPAQGGASEEGGGARGPSVSERLIGSLDKLAQTIEDSIISPAEAGTLGGGATGWGVGMGRSGGGGWGASAGLRRRAGQSRGGGSATGIGTLDLHDPEANPGDYAAAMRVLMGQGLDKKEAASLIGQMTAESRLGTMYGGKVLGVGTGDAGAASGLVQWHSDRWSPLVAWAKSQGINPASMSGQLKMAAHEYITRWRKQLRPAIEAATTPYDIAKGTDIYEGYRGWEIGPRGAAVSGTARALKEAGDAVTKPVPPDHVPNWGPWHKGGSPSGPIINMPHRPISRTPLNVSNWQAPDRGPNVAIHNKTGSDVFINASTLATT